MTATHRQPLVFIIPRLYRAGAERVLHEVLSHLNRNKYDLHLICFFKSASHFSFDAAIRIHYLLGDYKTVAKKNLATKAVDFLRGGIIALKLIRVLAKFPPKTLLVPFLEFSSIKALPAAVLFGHRIIARPASTGSAYIRYQFKNQWRQVFEKNMLRLDLACADKIIVQSKGVFKDYISQLSVAKEKICVIPNPVNLAMIRAKSTNSAVVTPTVTPPATVFAHVGRLVDKKNHRLLIDAAVMLRKDYPHFVVLCAGAGPEEVRIIRKIVANGLEKNIVMLGETDNPFGLMAQSRALIHTSQHESFGIVLVEAMASGTTVIAVNCPYGPAEILGNGKFGLLVPMNNPRALADAMYKIARDDDLFENFKARGQQRVLDFDASKIAKRWERLIDSTSFRTGAGQRL